MNGLLYGVAALGGYLVYENVNKAHANASQPPPEQKQPFWSDWLNQGTKVSTGNGANGSTDITAVSNAITSTERFVTSMASYFGGSVGNNAQAGSGVSANSSQIQSYEDGGNYGVLAPTGDDIARNSHFPWES